VKAFHLKKNLKVIFSNRRQLYVARGAVTPCLFCFVSFEAICDRYFFKLYCFKLIGWFYHHIAFPPIRSVWYRFLHCDYRTLHCDYRKLRSAYRNCTACCFGCTEINQSQSNNIIMYTNILVRRSGLFEGEGGLIDDILYEKENVLYSHDLLTMRLHTWTQHDFS
jgi:hypothetical protein